MSQTPEPRSDLDRPAFAREYRACADGLVVWMHLHVQGRLRDKVAADDLIQETWCRAYQAWSRFDPALGTFRAFLFGIAEKVLIEELRHLGRRPRPVGELPSSMSAAPSRVAAELTSISERAARSEFVKELLESAQMLPEDERELLLLRGIEEQPFEEIAARLGMTTEGARSRWRRVRERLRVPLRRFRLGR